jgi:hypothetical protein
MVTITQRIKALYLWPSGPPSALSYALILTIISSIALIQTRWMIALLFWPLLWVARVIVLLVMRIPQAQTRREESRREQG